MENKKDIISIIIPTYNEGLLLLEAVQSAVAIKNTSFNTEIIVVNDGGSIDNKVQDFISNNNICLLTKENGGCSSARNFGIRHCKGNYIIPLDADNKLHSEEIIHFYNNIISNNADITFGDCLIFGESNAFWKNQPLDIAEMAFNNTIDNCTLYKKSLWTKIGGYDESIPNHTREDWVFWMNSIKEGAIFSYLDKTFFFYRDRINSKIKSSVKLHRDKTLLFNYISSLQFDLLRDSLSKNKIVRSNYNRAIERITEYGSFYNLNDGNFKLGYKYLLGYFSKSFNVFNLIKMGMFYPIRFYYVRLKTALKTPLFHRIYVRDMEVLEKEVRV